MNDDETNSQHTLETLRLLENNSSFTQRELAKGLNLSLGKINFVLKSLLDQGLIKVERFKNSKKKRAYLYYLTPKGFERKMTLTKNFLKRKLSEYENLKREIEMLTNDLQKGSEGKN